jgi:hypothetical protein
MYIDDAAIARPWIPPPRRNVTGASGDRTGDWSHAKGGNVIASTKV